MIGVYEMFQTTSFQIYHFNLPSLALFWGIFCGFFVCCGVFIGFCLIIFLKGKKKSQTKPLYPRNLNLETLKHHPVFSFSHLVCSKHWKTLWEYFYILFVVQCEVKYYFLFSWQRAQHQRSFIYKKATFRTVLDKTAFWLPIQSCVKLFLIP